MRVRSLIALIVASLAVQPPVLAHLRPETIEARKLLDIPESALGYVAVQAVMEVLRREGETVSDFYVTPIKARSDGKLELSIGHKAAFEGSEVVGNPGGKSRTVIFDTESQKITQVLWWQ